MFGLRDVRWEPVGEAGFSGAAVWRGGGFALKRWPAGYPRGRLEQIHAWMHVAADELPFVPRPAGLEERDGALWDLQPWMPGAAEFRTDPSDARLRAAATALGRLHAAWRRIGVRPMPSRAVRDRVAALANPMTVAEERRPHALAALRPWADVVLPCHPCLRDVWHDHILFTGDDVTGIIDYGATDWDHPAADVARLFGDLVGLDRDRWAVGLAAYRAAVSAEWPDELAWALAEAGLIGALAGWAERRQPTGRAEARVRHLLWALNPLHPGSPGTNTGSQ